MSDIMERAEVYGIMQTTHEFDGNDADDRVKLWDLCRSHEALRTLLDKRTEALRVVTYTARSRGYPTPHEWRQVVSVAKQALEETEG